MRKFVVKGMSCAACSARVEKAVSKVNGVNNVTVNLLTGQMVVEGYADDKDIVSAVKNAGYSAYVNDNTSSGKDDNNAGAFAEETQKLFRNLVLSLLFLLPLIYISMGHAMWNWPLPAVLAESAFIRGMIQLYLTVIIMIINNRYFVNGVKSLMHGAPNMDTLVALGAGAAFAYSSYVLFAMAAALESRNTEYATELIHDIYFESTAMILTLITVGKYLESRSKGKTTNAIQALIDMTPKTATVVRGDREILIDVKDVEVGDVFIVKTGESIPVDGVILTGNASIDEAIITGESIPVDKNVDDSVTAGTINSSGYITCRATKVLGDSTITQIIKMVSEAVSGKPPIAKLADKVSGIFVPVVMGIAAVTIIVWLMLGENAGFALARGISVLVISCPCALGLATPVAIMVGNGLGARNGILFKNASSLEMAGRIKTVLFDKTGTITEGRPKVVEICTHLDENEFVRIAYSIEAFSEHPLAGAVKEYATENDIKAEEVKDYISEAGNGVSAVLASERYYAGKIDFVSKYSVIPEEVLNRAGDLQNDGNTVLYFAKEKEFLGIIAVADAIREDSRDAIAILSEMGIRTVMVTGDNEKVAKKIAVSAGIDNVIAELTPGMKEEIVAEYRIKGRTAMVGDGVNDAPALTAADLGIAVGNGTDIAIEAADVVLTKNSIMDVAGAIRLGRKTLRNIKENLFWAFLYNTVGIPVAAGVFIAGFGLKLNPMIGAMAMSLSSVSVVLNALRLNSTRINISHKENEKMTITIEISGMMCEHCEATVKKTLEAMDGVSEAIVSHKSGTAVVTLSKEKDVNELISAIEAKDYSVTGIK
ncbi:MAG: heavy metal translocating P-type ATPase [Butyrivibrio sp.]|nr:heavy metal translocating P-type ATPase [Butyrivibrio sp.]